MHFVLSSYFMEVKLVYDAETTAYVYNMQNRHVSATAHLPYYMICSRYHRWLIIV